MPGPEPVRPLVLIVDDVADVRLGLRFLLETDEFQVAEAWSAMMALAEMEKRKVDAMLVDLYMPGTMDGIGLIDKVRRMPRPHPAIIAMSGEPHRAYDTSLRAAQSVGADATLTKPIDRETLITTIRRLVGGGPALRVIPPNTNPSRSQFDDRAR